MLKRDIQAQPAGDSRDIIGAFCLAVVALRRGSIGALWIVYSVSVCLVAISYYRSGRIAEGE